MAKGPVITENIRQEMAKIYVEHPTWRAKEVENELKGKFKEKAPGLSSIQKELKRIRSREAERSPEEEKLNRIWTIGDLAVHELPAEAVRLLLLIQNQRKRELRGLLKVRAALWVARLYAIRESGPVKQMRPLDLLATWGETYALREKVCTISNTACDTADLDEGLLGDFGQVLEDSVSRIAADSLKAILKSGQAVDAVEFFSDQTALTEIIEFETKIFGYYQGDPDMDRDTLAVYRFILTDLEGVAKKQLRALEVEAPKVFIVALRKWIKDNIESLRLLSDNGPEDESKRDEILVGTDAAIKRIMYEVKAKTPTELIPVRAQEYFQKFRDGILRYGKDGKIQFDERRREDEGT